MFTFIKRFHFLTVLKIALMTAVPLLTATQLTGCKGPGDVLPPGCQFKVEVVTKDDGHRETRTVLECGSKTQEKDHTTPNSITFMLMTLCQSAPELCGDNKEDPNTIEFKTASELTKLRSAIGKVLNEVKIHTMSTAGTVEDGLAELTMSMVTDEDKQSLSIPVIITNGYATLDDIASASDLLTQMVIAAQNGQLKNVRLSLDKLSFSSDSPVAAQRTDTMTLTVFLQDRVLMTMTGTMGADVTRPGTGLIQEMR